MKTRFAFVLSLALAVGCANVQAQQSVARGNVNALLTAIHAFKIDTGTYPDSLQELVEAPEGKYHGWKGPYVVKIGDDPWGRDYSYTVNRGKIVIVSYGRDGQPGGTGADQDIEIQDPPGR